ncbi:SulP family inorganic anion transporter [Rhodocyclaceae bacterium SMB388]
MLAAHSNLAERLLPFLTWRRKWREHGVRGDLIAGVTVALVMIPQALAYAQLASLPPYIGLYACVLPAIIAALFGSCAQLSTGPVALTALLTGASLMPFARPDSPEFLTLAILLALMSGAIQLALGALRLGWLLNLLSRSVMTGFINAAALLICLSQIPALLGLTMNRSDHFLVDFWQLVFEFGAADLMSLLFGAGSFLCLIGLRRIAPRLPGVLLVVAAATAISALTGYAARGGAVIGEIPAGLPLPSVPAIDWSMALALLPAAFVIGLVSFMEATSSATLITGRTGEKWHQNQELIGQGLAKIASAFTGSMPVSASFSRSALNFATGARTGLASIVSVAVVVLTLLYLTPLLWHLPNAVLAAVILLVVSGLIDFNALRRAWQASRDDGIASAMTFGMTLAFAPNIQIGIMTGLLLSLSLMLYRDMQPRTVLLGLHPDGTYRDLERFGLAHPHPRLVILRFDSPLTFVTSEAFEKAALNAVKAQPNVSTLLISGVGINAIDASGLHTISSLQERLRTDGRTLAFCGLKKQIIDPMERTGLWERLQPHAHYRSVGHALDALLPTLGPGSESTESVDG